MSTFYDWYVSEPVRSLIEAWKRGLGYEGLEREVERTEPIEETLNRMQSPHLRSSRTYSIDPAGVVSSVLAHAHANHRRDETTSLNSIDALVRTANTLAIERYDGRTGSTQQVLQAYETYLLTQGAQPIVVRSVFDPIGFAASSPEQTSETAGQMHVPGGSTLVPLGSGALLAGYDLAHTLGLRADQVEPIHFSRYKSRMLEPFILPHQAERFRNASRIVIFDEDTETGSTLSLAARHLKAYAPVECATNGAPRFGSTRA